MGIPVVQPFPLPWTISNTGFRVYLAGQRCARKSTEFASGSKIVRDNRAEMEN